MQIHCKYDALVPVGELKPHPKNRNNHPPEQIARLAKLLTYQGLRAPIVVSSLSGCIVKGHGTLSAIKANGWVEAPVVYQAFTDEAQEYAFVQSDNAISLWAELDLSGINTDIGDLGPEFDIDLLGIKGFEIEVADKNLGDPDEVPEVPEEPKTKIGDIYQMGAHRLVCGDATNDSCWQAIKGDGRALVFTSPPYGLGQGAKLRDHYVKGAPKLDSLYNSHDDNPDEWTQLMRDWTAMALAHSDAVVCNVQMLANNKRAMVEWLAEFAPHLVDIAIWDKTHGPPQMQRNVLTNVFEFLIILSPELNASRTIPLADFHGTEGNVVRIGKAKNKEFADVHKATMPVELADWAISVAGATARHVIDPFGGTGTTMIAAEKAGKSCGMIEMDPSYCDVIVARWEQYTGMKGQLVRSGGDAIDGLGAS